jgi:hypothetical protein
MTGNQEALDCARQAWVGVDFRLLDGPDARSVTAWLEADVDFHWLLLCCIDNPGCLFLCGISVGSSDSNEL